MNIVNKITIKHLKENKRRTLVTIIGSAISVALIFSMMITVNSFLEGMRKDAIAMQGEWTTQFLSVDGSKVEELLKEDAIEKAMIFSDVGIAKLDGSTNLSKQYVYIQSSDFNDTDVLNVQINEGRLPKNENEIIVSQDLLDTSGVKYQIGDMITYQIGNRYHPDVEDGKEPLDKHYGYFEGETFVTEETKTYTIVGFVDNLTKTYYGGNYSIYTYQDTVDQDAVYQVYTKFRNIDFSLYDQARQLSNKYDKVGIEFNNQLLMTYGISDNQTFLFAMYGIVGVMAIIIMIGSISLIYNAFAISLAQRSKYLGMLSSVGATKKQKRSSVFFEAFVIGVIAIPLGLVIGYIGMFVTFTSLSETFKVLMSNSFGIQLNVQVSTIIISILFSALVLLLSAWVPAKRASKISPISAIRQNEEIKLNAKAVKTNKLTRKLLGFEKELALKNLKRNRSRYKATLFSLIISFVLFISAFSFMDYMKSSVGMSVSNVDFDVRVNVYNFDEEKREKSNLFLKEIEQVSGYTNLAKIRSNHLLEMSDSSRVTKRQKDLLEKSWNLYGDPEMEFDSHCSINLMSLDTKSYKDYAKDVNIEYKEGQNNAILLNTYTLKHHLESDENVYEEVVATDYKAGDTLLFQTVNSGDKKIYEKEIILSGVSAKTTPYQAVYTENAGDLYLIVDEKTYDTLKDEDTQESIVYYYTSETPSNLESNLYKVKNGYMDIDTSIFNAVSQQQQSNQMVLMLSVFLYGFVTLILLICMANIFNTISTGVLLRRQEFAMLKSVGMNRKDFRKMIAYESIFYGIKAILYGVPISILCSMLLYNVISNSFSFTYVLPITAIIIISVIVSIMIMITTIYSLFKVRNDNIVETIKNENL